MAFLHALIESAPGPLVAKCWRRGSQNIDSGGRTHPGIECGEAASDGFAAACLLPKIRANVYARQCVAFSPLCFLCGHRRRHLRNRHRLQPHPGRRRHLQRHHHDRRFPRRLPFIVRHHLRVILFQRDGFAFGFLSSSSSDASAKTNKMSKTKRLFSPFQAPVFSSVSERSIREDTLISQSVPHHQQP